MEEIVTESDHTLESICRVDQTHSLPPPQKNTVTTCVHLLRAPAHTCYYDSPICLIDDDELQVAEVEGGSLRAMVKQTARCRHQYVNSLTQTRLL